MKQLIEVETALEGCAAAWQAPTLPDKIPQGDMPGDKIQIGESHIQKAQTVFPVLCKKLAAVCAQNPARRAVVTVFGGSGVGKSEIASLLAYYLRTAGIGSYTLSGDNYPHRIPRDNDSERQRIFRQGGVRGLVTAGVYTPACAKALESLWAADADAAPQSVQVYPWLAVYQAEGRKALKGYLGTPAEQNFSELTQIVSQFKNGADSIWLKRMGRTEDALWYENVDFSATQVLLIEWTHGNSDWYQGVDVAISLNSTPQETAAHRRERNRDGKIDSPFTTMVLELEQSLLASQAPKADIIVAKNGSLLSQEAYRKLMQTE